MKLLKPIILTIFLLVLVIAPVHAQTTDEPAQVADFWQTYADAAVGGIPIVAPVFVLVELAKKFKRKDGSQAITGNALLVTSFGLGLAFGGAYMLYASSPPSVSGWSLYAYWFSLAVYGVTLGGLAAVGYDGIKALVERVFVKNFGNDLLRRDQ